MKIAITGLAVLIVCGSPTLAEQLWCWRFAGLGVSAAGTFLTEEVADADGYYRITAITGRANAATIMALQPTSTPGATRRPSPAIRSAAACSPPSAPIAPRWPI